MSVSRKKEMNLEALAPYGLTVIVGIIGWFVRVLWEADKELRESLSKMREEMPRSYVLREDYRRDIYEIKDLLKEIRAGLDGKVDK